MKKLTGARYTWKQMLRALHKLGYSLKVLKHLALPHRTKTKSSARAFYANHHACDRRRSCSWTSRT